MTYLCTVFQNNTIPEVNNRSIRLTVRTADSHSANTSSILVWSTKDDFFKSAFFVCRWFVPLRRQENKKSFPIREALSICSIV